MPIWTQEQLFDLVSGQYTTIKAHEGKAPPEQLAEALKQTQIMETWLDAPLRDKLDEMFER